MMANLPYSLSCSLKSYKTAHFRSKNAYILNVTKIHYNVDTIYHLCYNYLNFVSKYLILKGTSHEPIF